MAGADLAGLDPGADEIAVAALGGEVRLTRRRRAVRAVDRSAKRVADAAQDRVAHALAGARDLLDTLAVRFREEGWSMKRLVREIVTSSTWRMESVADPRAVERDPRNLLLHHFPLRRLEGESVRDKILAVSGRLDP
jgi:hypothetical protein